LNAWPSVIDGLMAENGWIHSQDTVQWSGSCLHWPEKNLQKRLIRRKLAYDFR